MSSDALNARLVDSFVFNAHPSRVIFGSGSVSQLTAEVDRYGLSRVLIISTPDRQVEAESLSVLLADRAVAIFAGAVMHTPLDVTDEVMRLVNELKIDGLVAVGGGSTTGLSKAIAYRTDLPQFIIPTTYAGSEMTPILGETSNGRKVTKSDPKILPEVVIYDVDKTMTLPVAISVSSGINAIAHAVEALYAVDRNPIVTMYAESAIASLNRALRKIVQMPFDPAARSEALYGAWLSGVCLGSVGMALHHKLCHVLGGAFGLPHAEMHTAVLPHAVAYNRPAALDATHIIARALGAEDAADGLFELAKGLGANMALRDLGMPEAGIDLAADEALKNRYPNPRPLDRKAIRGLLERAWRGDPPRSV